MFRIAFFVEDRNLAPALWAINGLALDMEVPQPVVNAVVAPTKLVAETDGSPLSMFLAHLRKAKAKSVVARDVRAFLAGIKRSESSAGYVLQLATRRGYLRKQGVGSKTAYLVVKAK